MSPRALQTGPDFAAIHSAAPSPPGRELASGETWRLVELLGRGGSAEVWRAVDAAGRSAALKIPHLPAGHPRSSVDGLRREHSLLAALAHDRVVATLGLVAVRETTALALEYLPGGDLVALAGAHPRHWIEAACDVHAALVHLHARGFVHRDVKARNVLFAADGRARLIDFASLLPRGAVRPGGGTTAAHSAPVEGEAVDADDDLYAFAVLLYELLAGRLPYGIAGRDAAASRRDPPWPAAPGADPAAAALAECSLDVLRGRAAGFSALADVLEFAAAAYR